MLETKIKLELLEHNFSIKYFEIDSISDIEYFVVLLVNRAADSKKELSEIVKNFTKEDNDLKLIIEKKFEKLFNKNIEEYKEILKQAKAMKEETKKLIPSKENRTYLFDNNLGLYLYDSEYKDENFIMAKLEEYISENKNWMFDQIDIEQTSKIKAVDIEVSISNELTKVNLAGLEDVQNKETVDNVINNLSNETIKFVNFDPSNVEIFSKIPADYKLVDRNFNEDSKFTLLSDINDLEDSLIMEYDLGSSKYILSKFASTKNILFYLEKKYDRDELLNNFNVNDIIKVLEDNFEEIPNKYISDLIRNSKTKEELSFIREKGLYQVDKKASFLITEVMINEEINIITDDVVVKGEMFDQLSINNQLQLYRYLNIFYNDDKFDDISDKKKNNLLLSVFNIESTSLSKKDYEYTSELIKNTENIKQTLKDLIMDIASMRPDLTKKRDAIQNEIETLDSSDVEKSEELIKLEQKISDFRRITNFFVHIYDGQSKKYKKDEKVVKDLNPKLMDLRQEVNKGNTNNIVDFEIYGEYILILDNIKSKIKDII